VLATLLVEVALFAAGVWLYARMTKARDGVGRWAFPVFVGLLAVICVGNVSGPAPPSVQALKIVAFAGFLIPIWAGRFHRRRSLRARD
jgi:predicted membrane metal-binding protein